MRQLLYVGCRASERPIVGQTLGSAGFNVRWADDGPQALAALGDAPCPVLLDLASDDALPAGLEIRACQSAAVIAAVADPARPSLSERARRVGLGPILDAPLDPAALLAAFAPDVAARAQADSRDDELPEGLVAASGLMKDVARRVNRAMRDGGAVLLRGEPGTGRSFLARALHSAWCGSNGQLVEVNCAPSPGTDLELQMFGTTTGNGAPMGGPAHGDNRAAPPRQSGGGVALRPSYGRRRSDALQPPPLPGHASATERISRASLLCQAFGGTLVLWNVADMPARVQARLVRVLRDGEAGIVGDGTIRGLIRVVTCVEPGFDADVEEGRIRPDLLKRLAAERIDLPPLRDRRDDVPGLVNLFLAEACALLKTGEKKVSHPAMTLLTSLPYRGNIRELRSLIRTLVERSDSAPIIRLEDVLRNLRFEVSSGGALNPVGTLKDARTRFEQQYVRAMLERHHGRIAEAARSLGIQRTNLYRKMRTLGIQPAPGSRPPGEGSGGRN